MSSNLTGENFPEYVQKQISKRQELMAEGFVNDQHNILENSKSKEKQKFFDNNQGFINVVSCINLDIQKIKDKNKEAGLESIFDSYELGGNTLAKNFILRGGVSSNEPFPSSFRRGIRDGENTSLINNSAYGIGNLQKYGQKPMPSLENMEVKSKNRGSLREATLKIKAFSTEDFKVIDALYMRLGYNIFVEWGHAFLLNNEGKVEGNGNSLMNLILEKKNKTTDLYKVIEDKRLESDGNYDAFLGKIKNYSWSISSDGVYDIDLNIISAGDVIESLKINTQELQTKGLSSAEKEEIAKYKKALKETKEKAKKEGYVAAEAEDSDVSIWSKRAESDINWFLYRVATLKGGDDAWFSDVRSPDTWRATEPGGGARQPPVVVSRKPIFSLPSVTKPIRYRATADVVYLDFEDVGSTTNNYYIRLGAFLEFIEQVCMLYEADENGQILEELRICSDGELRMRKKPIVRISYNPHSNFCFTTPFHISADPRVCVLAKMVKVGQFTLPPELIEEHNVSTNDGGTVGGYWKKLYPNLNSFDYPQIIRPEAVGDEISQEKGTSIPHGKIMNIYVSFIEIMKSLESATTKNEDDTSTTNLYDFLAMILKDISHATGNINDFQLVLDPDTNFLKIIDATRIEGYDKIAKELNEAMGNKEISVAKFAIKNNIRNKDNKFESPIITDFSIKTEMSSKMATIITVGAQNPDSATGKGMGIANLNHGFENRIVKNILKSSGKTTTGTTPEEKFSNNLTDYNTFLESQIDTEGSTMWSWFWDDDSYWDESLFDSTRSLLNGFLSFAIAQEAKKSKTDNPQIGFIPINLSLTFPGISGIKIYNKFTVDSKFLPTNYGSSLTFLVKGVSHSFSGDKWETKIESLSIPSKVAKGNKILPTKLLEPGPISAQNQKTTEDTGDISKGQSLKLGEGIGDGELFSITSGLPLWTIDEEGEYGDIGKKYTIVKTSRGNSPINRIWLHHTAGWDKRHGTIEGWTHRFWEGIPGKIHTPFIIGRSLPEGYSGFRTKYTTLIEQLYDEEEYTGWASSTNSRGDKGTVNIELAGVGYIVGGPRKNEKVAAIKGLDPDTDLYYASYPQSNGEGIYQEHEIAKPVDKDLKELPSWQGHEYYVKYPPEQIKALEELLITLIKKYNGDAPSKKGIKHNVIPDDNVIFKWDNVFGPPRPSSKIWSERGLFGHSASSGKSDAWPQKEMVEMLMNVQAKAEGKYTPPSTYPSTPPTPQEASGKDVRLGVKIWREFQKVLIQEDSYGDKGSPLLSPQSQGDVNKNTTIKLLEDFIRYRPYDKDRDQKLSPTSEAFDKWGVVTGNNGIWKGTGKKIPNATPFSSLQLENIQIQPLPEGPIYTRYSPSHEKFNKIFRDIVKAIDEGKSTYLVDWYQQEGLSGGADISLNLPSF